MFNTLTNNIVSGRKTLVKEIIAKNHDRITVEIIREASLKKDELVLEILDDSARKLAFGMTNIINLLNPEVIVIGGEITKLGNVFLERIKKYIEDIQLKPNKDKIEIRYSSLKGNTVTLGGAKYVLDNIFEPGILLDGIRF